MRPLRSTVRTLTTGRSGRARLDARRFAVAALCAVALLAGCSLGPPEQREPEQTSTPDAAAQRLLEQTRERPDAARSGPTADVERPASARAALTAFAGAWGRRTAPDGPRELAALSSGRLRDVLAQDTGAPAPDVAARAQAFGGSELLEGIVMRPGEPALVVTKTETVFEEGETPQTLYSVYLARAERVAGTWKVIQWTSAN